MLLIVSGLATAGGGSDDGSTWTVCPVDHLPRERSEWWPDAAPLVEAREAAFDWLEDRQAQDGSWTEDFGVTALVAFAFLNGGASPDHPVVARALGHVLGQAQEDGAFSGGTYVHYYTSTAVMALSAAGRANDEAIVQDAVDMLVRDQCDGDEEGFEEWWRGGIGYGGDGRPDLSNTQFALMALAAAEAAYPSISVPRSTWENAMVFLYRTQNLPEVNDLDWDDDPSAPSFGDGGFAYFPGRSNVGGTVSYGSMTAAGLWSLLAAGETLSSASASSALTWLGAHFSASENPGFGEVAYYYYAWTLARALRAAGAPALVSGDGEVVHWAKELAPELVGRQGADGRWTNTDSDAYWEGLPEVATTFALLALEAMLPSEGAGLRVRAPDGGSVTITDGRGRTDAEIPRWFQDGDGTVGVSDASEGPYTVTVEGADSVEVASEVGGTVKLWREVGLAREGGAPGPARRGR
jgi:squalene-hopene/tetraprenyl-beta-curcumene cyclase